MVLGTEIRLIDTTHNYQNLRCKAEVFADIAMLRFDLYLAHAGNTSKFFFTSVASDFSWRTIFEKSIVPKRFTISSYRFLSMASYGAS